MSPLLNRKRDSFIGEFRPLQVFEMRLLTKLFVKEIDFASSHRTGPSSTSEF